jgi:hypothetical protein
MVPRRKEAKKTKEKQRKKINKLLSESFYGQIIHLFPEESGRLWGFLC